MVGIIPLSPPQKDTRYTEDTTGKPTVYFWNWLTLLQSLVTRPAGLKVVTGTFTATLTGFSGAAPTGSIHYTLLGDSTNGGLCYLTSPNAINGTSNAVTFGLTGIPTICQGPSGTLPSFAMSALNSGSTVLATGTISVATMTFSIYKTVTGANPQPVVYSFTGWTNSGTKGLITGWSVLYSLT